MEDLLSVSINECIFNAIAHPPCDPSGWEMVEPYLDLLHERYTLWTNAEGTSEMFMNELLRAYVMMHSAPCSPIIMKVFSRTPMKNIKRMMGTDSSK